jgi:hypothetical protein
VGSTKTNVAADPDVALPDAGECQSSAACPSHFFVTTLVPKGIRGNGKDAPVARRAQSLSSSLADYSMIFDTTPAAPQVSRIITR